MGTCPRRRVPDVLGRVRGVSNLPFSRRRVRAEPFEVLREAIPLDLSGESGSSCE